MMEGSWVLMSYSFQRGFEAMWDLAQADHPDHSPLLEMPLLSLWRQSIELTLKSCILEIGGSLDKRYGHKLQDLFEEFKTLSTNGGLNNNDDLTRNVQEMIAFTQSFDPYADRFRYPTNKQGDAYKGINIDLEKLFKAHWIIVTYCEGAVAELGE
jgi:HEPN domain-containing protein